MSYTYPVLCHAWRLLIGHWSYKWRAVVGAFMIKISGVIHDNIYRLSLNCVSDQVVVRVQVAVG